MNDISKELKAVIEAMPDEDVIELHNRWLIATWDTMFSIYPMEDSDIIPLTNEDSGFDSSDRYFRFIDGDLAEGSPVVSFNSWRDDNSGIDIDSIVEYIIEYKDPLDYPEIETVIAEYKTSEEKGA